MPASSRYNGWEATPAEGVETYIGTMLESIVELCEVQLSVRRPMGDALLFGPIRSLGAGCPNPAQLRFIAVLGNHSGIRAKSSAVAGREARLNEATIKSLPFQVHATYDLSHSTLKLRSKNNEGRRPWARSRNCGEAQRDSEAGLRLQSLRAR